MLLHCSVPSGGAVRPWPHGYDGSEQAVQAVRLAWPRREPYFCQRQSVDATCGINFKLFKPLLQTRERDDLIVVFVIHYPINRYDNPTKNRCSERDPPRPRSEQRFYGKFLLVNSYAAIYMCRRLSRPVPVFAQIEATRSQTNQADSGKSNTIRRNHG